MSYVYELNIFTDNDKAPRLKFKAHILCLREREMFIDQIITLGGWCTWILVSDPFETTWHFQFILTLHRHSNTTTLRYSMATWMSWFEQQQKRCKLISLFFPFNVTYSRSTSLFSPTSTLLPPHYHLITSHKLFKILWNAQELTKPAQRFANLSLGRGKCIPKYWTGYDI